MFALKDSTVFMAIVKIKTVIIKLTLMLMMVVDHYSNYCHRTEDGDDCDDDE